MGYVRQRKTYRLIFDDAEFAGLEVVTASASVATYRHIAGLATRDFGVKPTADDLAAADHLFEAFAEVLMSWNLEEPEGVPVPATVDGLRAQDLPFAMAIIVAWMTAVAGVSVPLGLPSSGGDAALVASLPMEVLSPSL